MCEVLGRRCYDVYCRSLEILLHQVYNASTFIRCIKRDVCITISMQTIFFSLKLLDAEQRRASGTRARKLNTKLNMKQPNNEKEHFASVNTENHKERCTMLQNKHCVANHKEDWSLRIWKEDNITKQRTSYSGATPGITQRTPGDSELQKTPGKEIMAALLQDRWMDRKIVR